MKKTLLFFCALFTIALLHAQTPGLQWARSVDGTNNSYSRSIATDTFGNVYTTGYFNGTADFDPGAGVYNLTASGKSSKPDLFIQKLDATGNFVWAVSIGDTGTEVGSGITTDAAGNVYVTGQFFGTVDFDPGPGISNLTSAGDVDIFVMKLSAAGSLVWAKSMGGTYGDLSNAIAVDASGNVYTAGRFIGTADFDPGAAVYPLTATGASDIFISKLDASGSFVWAKSMGSATDDAANGIALDKSGNVYTTGFFYNTVDFDPGPGISNLTSSGTTDVFVLKLSNAGSFVWARNMGGATDDWGNAIAVDASGSNVYTTGYFAGTADFDPGPGTTTLHSVGINDIFISKLDASGNYLWAKSMGGTSTDVGYGIALDGSGNVYTTGYFAGMVDFDPGPGVYNLNALAYGAFVLKLDGSGNYAWAKAMTGATIHDNALGIALTVDPFSNVYTAGQFNDTVDFDPDAGVSNLITKGTGYEMFVQKLHHCAFSAATLTQTACNRYVLGGHTYTTGGTYLQTLVNAVGCDSFVTLNLTINKVNDTVKVSGDTLTVSATSAAYQWVKCPAYTVIPGATTNSYIALASGSYAVIVTGLSGCTDTSDCHTVTGLGIDEHTATLPLQITPNPTRGILTIHTGIPVNDLSVKVMSLTGATVLEKAFVSGADFTLDMSSLPGGVYFVKVMSGSQAFAVEKIVKE